MSLKPKGGINCSIALISRTKKPYPQHKKFQTKRAVLSRLFQTPSTPSDQSQLKS